MRGRSVFAATQYDRRILRLAIPALGALAADPLVSLVDTAFVGRLGATELGALGINAAVFSLAFILFNFLAYGTTPLVAAAWGKGDREEAGRVVTQAIGLAIVIGTIAAASLEVLWHPLLRAMQAGPDLLAPAGEYLRIRALAAPAVLLVTVGHGAYRGLQDTRTPLLVTVGLNLINLVGDPLLIFVAGWGLRGAAVATVFAQWSGALWFLVLLNRKRRELGIPIRVPRLSEFRPLATAGSELIVRTAGLLTVFTMATAVAARMGTATVAAHQVAAQVWLFLSLVLDSLAIAGQALVGNYLGTGQVDDARAASNRMLQWGFGFGTILGAIFWLLGPSLPKLFTNDTEIVALVGGVMPFVAVLQPIGALVFVWDGIFMGARKFRFLMLSTLAAALVAAVVLILVVTAGWGLTGVWWGITTLILGRLGLLAFRYRTTFV
ncbi:MAG: MATE family efflux transporter [Acidimicrobiia bacterium]|nr:MATE family efflux transporter [Acidimicrobiia bacterium]MDH3396462.1 MATE family efflux transporter [Acidimicrobiia bacterium]MDH5615688.1 MATE family efflux transporter [Acidimicrobiia bacterium]